VYVNIVHSRIDMSRLAEAVAAIPAIKARLASRPGFRGAYWFEPVAGLGMSLNLWEEEAQARAAAFEVGESPAPGVTVERVETRAVLAQG
jgi:hypothetical protein